MEIWKDSISMDGSEVSSIGNSRLKGRTTNRSLLNDKGYRRVGRTIKRKKKMYSMHRLVAEAFIPNTEDKPWINHKNGIKDDNRVENLEWCTISENTQHAYDILGRRSNFQTNHPFKGKKGKLSPFSKKVNQYNMDGTFIKEWSSLMDIERELNIQQVNIGKVCRGKRKTAGGYKWEYAV